MTTVLPRGAYCDRLAQAFDQLGEGELGLAWTQRWLALRPGSAEAMEQFLRRAAAARDPARISEAIGWVLAQPRPLGDFAEPIAASLDALVDLDRPRARALARRALDFLGPRVPVLRAHLLDLSQRAADPGLAIAVLERYLAAEGLGAFAAELLVELARRRTEAGDYDGAARELARAAEAGGDAEAVLTHAEHPRGGDARGAGALARIGRADRAGRGARDGARRARPRERRAPPRWRSASSAACGGTSWATTAAQRRPSSAHAS